MWLQNVLWVNDYDILFQTFTMAEFSTNDSWLFRGMISYQYDVFLFFLIYLLDN